MINMINNITHKDFDLFVTRNDTDALTAHVISQSIYLTFHDCLISYDPTASMPFTEDLRPPVIMSVAGFRTTNSDDYARLLALYKRGKLAAIKAVTDRWAEENPLDYIDFLNSDLSIFEYAKKFDKHSPKVKQEASREF